MRASSFLGSLIFAALAGLVVIPWTLAVSPIVGGSWAVGLYSLSLSGVYLLWIAPTWRRGLLAFAAAAVLSLGLAVLAPMPVGGVLGAALIVTVGRSGFLFAGRPLRVLVVECLLVGGGLVFARTFGSSLFGLGLAFWGFFLVQSLFFLVGGKSERREEAAEGDPFESARRRALTLMEQEC